MDDFQQRPKDAAAERLECHILVHSLKPHDRLPSERDLCDLYGFNRMTLRSAIQTLLGEGILYAKQGSGTYVAEPRISRELFGLHSMTEYAALNQWTMSSSVLSFKIMESDKKISRRLQILLGSKVYELIRLRRINGVPQMLETVYMPVDRFPGLLKHDMSASSLYQILEEHYGVYVDGGEESIGVTYLNEYEAALLNCPENSPAFFIQSDTYDVARIPVEYLKSINRADNFYYSNTLSIREE